MRYWLLRDIDGIDSGKIREGSDEQVVFHKERFNNSDEHMYTVLCEDVQCSNEQRFGQIFLGRGFVERLPGFQRQIIPIGLYGTFRLF